MAPSNEPKAWTFTTRGSPQSILSLTPTPLPTLPPTPLPKGCTPTEEWLLLKTTYVGLNPGSLYFMGLIPAWARARIAVPEMDLSATVEDVLVPEGDESEFRKGDKVVGFIPGWYSMPTGTGALATHLALPARLVIRKPEEVSARDAGGWTTAAGTAWQLLEFAEVKEGDRVLVYGASGGIGTMAVQMARNVVGKDGFVVGVCSGRNAELVKSLGADEVIDYTQHKNLPAHLKTTYASTPFNAILDTLGKQPVYKHSADYLVPQGIYAATKVETADFGIRAFIPALLTMKANEMWPLSPWLGGTGRTWRSAKMLDPSRETKEEVMGMLRDGRVKVVVDSVWEMGRVLEGYEILEKGRARGKVLVKVDDDDEV